MNIKGRAVRIPIKQEVPKNSTKITAIFNQHYGVGDILFIEPIMRKFFQDGYKVVLPVIPKYLDLKSNFPYINFVNKYNYEYSDSQQITKTKNSITYPVRWSMEYFRSPLNDTMRNKYRMFDLPLEMWRTLTWLRHRWKEDKLINKLGIDLSNDYVLVINKYHSFKNLEINIKLKTKKKIVELLPIQGYTLLDWVKIIENASEIHSVNTSSLFLFETLELKTKEIHLYTRGDNKGRDFEQTEYLRSKNYILHD